MLNNRLIALIKKEFIQMSRDRLTLAMMLMLPFFQLLLFGYAINTDVKHLPMVVYDMSNTEESRVLIQSFSESEYFDVKYYTSRYSEVTSLIDSGRARVGLVIDRDYARNLKTHKTAYIQVIVDASDPMTSTATLGNASGIGTMQNVAILMRNQRPGSAFTPDSPPVDVRIRGWYNPDLVSSYFIVPGLIGTILMMTMMIITSMAIVREREHGTLEQLITTPIKNHELMIGKILPYISVGYVQITIALTVGHFIFGVPIRGSVLLLYLLAFVFIVCYLGLGLLVSTVARTQQQAMQMSFFVFLPTLLLSGFMFPREGMPVPAQILGLIFPLTYFLQILRAIILKGVGIEYLWRLVLPMALIAFVILTISILRFKKQID